MFTSKILKTNSLHFLKNNSLLVTQKYTTIHLDDIVCSFALSNDQDLVRAQLAGKNKHSSSEILLILLAIRRNSNYYKDNDESKENIIMFTNLLCVLRYPKCLILAMQNPKDYTNISNNVHFRSYPVNMEICVLPLFRAWHRWHGNLCFKYLHMSISDQLTGKYSQM